MRDDIRDVGIMEQAPTAKYISHSQIYRLANGGDNQWPEFLTRCMNAVNISKILPSRREGVYICEENRQFVDLDISVKLCEMKNNYG